MKINGKTRINAVLRLILESGADEYRLDEERGCPVVFAFFPDHIEKVWYGYDHGPVVRFRTYGDGCQTDAGTAGGPVDYAVPEDLIFW